MSGYCEDFSMSRNARAAYEGGEMPWSKWTKKAMMEAARELDEAGETTQKGRFRWLTWAGTRKHPKAVEHVLERAVVTIRGQFYHVKDEKGNDVVRKMVGSNGTEFTPAT